MTSARSTSELDERIAPRLRRRQRVRHHRSLGQELPHAPLHHARAEAPAQDLRRRPLRRDAHARGRVAARLRSRRASRRARAGRRSSTSRTTCRAASARRRDFLMALQLTGAYKKSSAREPPGAAARGRHRRRPHRDRHRDRAPRLLPRADREDRAARPRRSSPRRATTPSARCSTTRSGASSRCSSSTRSELDEERERAAKEGPRRRASSRCSTSGAASRSSTAARCSTRRRTASTTKRCRRASRRACATSRTSRRPRRCSTSTAHVKAMKFDAGMTGERERGRAPGAHGLRRRRHEPQHDVREGVRRAPSRST